MTHPPHNPPPLNRPPLPRPPLPGPHRRGFAALFAIVLLGLTASALTLLATWMSSDAARAARDVTDAQLRTLLRAQADALLAADPTDKLQPLPLPLPLPPQLTEAGYSLHIAELPATTTGRTALITATAGRRTLSESLTVDHTRASEIRLNP